MLRLLIAGLGVSLICLLAPFAAPAFAHPHVWVAAKVTVLFDAQGRVTGLRQEWTFDDMYSSFQLQNAGKDGKPATKDDLAGLAKLQIEQLAEFQYFTVAKADGSKQAFGAPGDVGLEENAEKLVTLSFTLPLKTPVRARKAFAVQVFDQSYFVDFQFEKKDGVTTADAPKGCSARIVEPPPLIAEDMKRKDESFFTGLAPGANLGEKLASSAVIACP